MTGTKTGQIAPFATRRLHGAVQDKITDLIDKGRTPAQIDRELSVWTGKGSGHALEGLPRPGLRTIQRMWKLSQPKESASAWGLGDTEIPETPFLFAVLGEILKRSEGHRDSLTRPEAAWVRRIGFAAPAIPHWWAYRIARAYVARGEDGTEDLDQVLALRPWDGPEAFAQYEKLVRTDKGRPHTEGFNLALVMAGTTD